MTFMILALFVVVPIVLGLVYLSSTLTSAHDVRIDAYELRQYR